MQSYDKAKWDCFDDNMQLLPLNIKWRAMVYSNINEISKLVGFLW